MYALALGRLPVSMTEVAGIKREDNGKADIKWME